MDKSSVMVDGIVYSDVFNKVAVQCHGYGYYHYSNTGIENLSITEFFIINHNNGCIFAALLMLIVR